MNNRLVSIAIASVFGCLPSLGCGKSDSKDKETTSTKAPKTGESGTAAVTPGDEGTPNDKAKPLTSSSPEDEKAAKERPAAEAAGEDATIEQWVAMWQAVGKAGDAAGGDCDKAAAAWTKLFKDNRSVFQSIAKLGETQSEDELTAKFAERIKEPTGQFMELSKQCGHSEAMMEALGTMNRMYSEE